MSYILDALKKADRERNIGEVPDLETSHWGVRRQAQSPRFWVWVIGALLIFNGLLAAYLLGSRDQPQTTADTTAPMPEVQPPLVSGDVNQPIREPVVSSRPKIPVPPPLVRKPARPAVTRPTVAPDANIGGTASPPAGVQAVAPARQPPAFSAAEFDIPEWRDLSLEFRSRFTLPRIDVHVYAEDPARRFIMADLKKYREGDTMANGAVLEKIHPGSIQLNYQGTRFRVER